MSAPVCAVDMVTSTRQRAAPARRSPSAHQPPSSASPSTASGPSGAREPAKPLRQHRGAGAGGCPCPTCRVVPKFPAASAWAAASLAARPSPRWGTTRTPARRRPDRRSTTRRRRRSPESATTTSAPVRPAGRAARVQGVQQCGRRKGRRLVWRERRCQSGLDQSGDRRLGHDQQHRTAPLIASASAAAAGWPRSTPAKSRRARNGAADAAGHLRLSAVARVVGNRLFGDPPAGGPGPEQGLQRDTRSADRRPAGRGGRPGEPPGRGRCRAGRGPAPATGSRPAPGSPSAHGRARPRW